MPPLAQVTRETEAGDPGNYLRGGVPPYKEQDAIRADMTLPAVLTGIVLSLLSIGLFSVFTVGVVTLWRLW